MTIKCLSPAIVSPHAAKVEDTVEDVFFPSPVSSPRLVIVIVSGLRVLLLGFDVTGLPWAAVGGALSIRIVEVNETVFLSVPVLGVIDANVVKVEGAAAEAEIAEAELVVGVVSGGIDAALTVSEVAAIHMAAVRVPLRGLCCLAAIATVRGLFGVPVRPLGAVAAIGRLVVIAI